MGRLLTLCPAGCIHPCANWMRPKARRESKRSSYLPREQKSASGLSVVFRSTVPQRPGMSGVRVRLAPGGQWNTGTVEQPPPCCSTLRRKSARKQGVKPHKTTTKREEMRGFLSGQSNSPTPLRAHCGAPGHRTVDTGWVCFVIFEKTFYKLFFTDREIGCNWKMRQAMLSGRYTTQWSE